ncbi:MAG: hypothetical protein ABI472_03550 [Ginsengibacter sp.]
MKRTLLLLLLLNFATGYVCSQSITLKDLLTLSSSVPLKDIDHFMNKKSFVVYSSKADSNVLEKCFGIKEKRNKKYIGPKRTVVICLKKDSRYFTFHTSSFDEYLEGKKFLVKSGFFFDDTKDINKDTSILFQNGNITIQANNSMEDGVVVYNFILNVQQVPTTIKYAEDLLQFDSHELLVSFFGSQNVKKDMYYFSEKELKKCSVLFSGTRYQVLFVWGDENNLNNLSYILIPHVLPTKGADGTNAITGNNEWPFRNGIYPGMNIKELLRLNEMDFDIYGNTSELAFMVKPIQNGKIDFNKTAVMLSCASCNDIKMFNKQEVSALEVAKQDLPMYVNDVIIYPTRHQ